MCLQMNDKSKKYITFILGIFCAIFCGTCFYVGQDDWQSQDQKVNSNSESALEQSSFSICFLDVGHADAALVKCDDKYMLIDGGNAADSSKVYKFLEEKNIKYLDVIVASHMHEDHVGGLAGALNYASAGSILCPVTDYETDEFKAFKKYAERYGGIVVPKEGAVFKLGSADVMILGLNEGNQDNDSSLILKIVYGETAFLFTGDAERVAEEAILESGFDLSANVLKVSHHGSDTSTSYPFLREVMPQYAVISVGKDNMYGHPSESVLSRLEDAGVMVYRTDYHGDIWCYSDGKNIRFETLGTEEAIDTDYDYILNVRSKKFHYIDCESVLKMSEKNKSKYAGSREGIVEMGYSPCGLCKP